MSFEKFELLKSTAVPLPNENVDTDQIIPARFLKAVERKGFGENLFRDWRYHKSNEPIKSFVLNDARYSGQILVAGKNFGCGSSREHAAWALYDYGFRVIVSSYFADIFKNNAYNNGLVPIQLSQAELDILMDRIINHPNTVVEIDLKNQRLNVDEIGLQHKFEINQYKKECLINGYDDFTYLHHMLSEIERYEHYRNAAF